MAMDVEAEIRDLKRRVGEIEGSFGFLTEQIKAVHKDLLTFQARTEQRFDKLEQKTDQRFDKVDGRLDQVEKEVRGLRKDMPGIVGAAMQEALRERPRKSRKTP
jgi:predicted  nucleic acid-binding Zn-ribbon protein